MNKVVNMIRRLRRTQIKIQKIEIDLEKCKAALEMERYMVERLGDQLTRADAHVEKLTNALVNCRTAAENKTGMAVKLVEVAGPRGCQSPQKRTDQ